MDLTLYQSDIEELISLCSEEVERLSVQKDPDEQRIEILLALGDKLTYRLGQFLHAKGRV